MYKLGYPRGTFWQTFICFQYAVFKVSRAHNPPLTSLDRIRQ